MPAQIRDEQEESNNGEKLAENSFIDKSEIEDEDDENENVVNAKGIKIKLLYTFKGEKFSLPPDDVDTWTPLSYFEVVWKHDLNVLLAEKTNISSIQKTGRSLNTTTKEIEQLIGIQICMSIIDFSNFCMYWANERRYPTIADIMS